MQEVCIYLYELKKYQYLIISPTKKNDNLDSSQKVAG